MKVFVTGSAGFIGHHISTALAARGDIVMGVDNINPYYDPALKYARLQNAGFKQASIKSAKDGVAFSSSAFASLSFARLDINQSELLEALLLNFKPDIVIHLAAQAGVRYSLISPKSYISSNIDGFLSILNACLSANVSHLFYASSSSVYGLNEKLPFKESDPTDSPASLYAATKKANELMAHSFSHIHGLKTTGLRFFTAYGEWGRPDMALFKFVKAALENKPIELFANAKQSRDFTYIQDIVDGVLLCVDNKNRARQIYNIGRGKSVDLLDFVKAIEKVLNKEIKKSFLPAQAGDVSATYADISAMQNDFSYKPKTDLLQGIKRFVEWYINFYGGEL